MDDAVRDDPHVRPFGENGPRCRRLGLGTAAFAGVNLVGSPDYRAPGPERVEAILRFAAEALAGPGVLALVDTAAQYGAAERLLGECLAAQPGLRSRVWVATKWGLCFHSTEHWRQDYSPANLRRSVETSARHLGRIDLLYLHTNPGVELERIRWLLRGGDGCLDGMRELKKRRVHGIAQLGVSLSTVEGLRMVLEAPDLLADIDAIQLNASILLAHPELAARLQAIGIAVVLNSPFRKGDLALRATPAGVRAIYHRILDALPDAFLLTGSADPAHLRQNLDHLESWGTPCPLETAYAAAEIWASEAREVEAALAGRLRDFDVPPACESADLALSDRVERIARLLVGTRKTRLGAAPAGAALDALHRRIADHVARGLPVDAILTWGPRKFYAAPPDNAVDVAELAALEVLRALHAQVRGVHPAGLRFVVFYEDCEGTFIEGEPSEAFWPYGAGLVRLVNLLGLASLVRIRSTSGLLRHRPASDVRERLAANYELLRRHWHESERRGIERFEECPSYAPLLRLGFAGPISQESRRFYLERLDRLVGDRRTPDEKVDMVIRLFAAVLLHRQLDLFRVREGLDPVKLSFLRIAGGPASLQEGRIDIRSIASDVSKRSMAPWSAKGYLRRKGGAILPAQKPWPEPLPDGGRMAAGELRLRRGASAAALRADLLQTPA